MTEKTKNRPCSAEVVSQAFGRVAPNETNSDGGKPGPVELRRDLYQTTARESRRQVELANEFAAEHGPRLRFAPGLDWLFSLAASAGAAMRVRRWCVKR